MFTKYSGLLTKEENKWFNIASDWIDKHKDASDYKEKDKYLGGFEGVDFGTLEQIDYTCEHMK